MAALKEEVDKLLKARLSGDCKMGEPNGSYTQEGWKMEGLCGFQTIKCSNKEVSIPSSFH